MNTAHTVTIGNLTLDAMMTETIRAMVGSGQSSEPPWPDGISREEFCKAFGIGRGKGYKALHDLIESGKWEVWSGVRTEKGKPKFRTLYHPASVKPVKQP